MIQLPRRFGLLTVIAIVIGDVIGSGIFVKPSSIAQQVPDVGLILFLWLMVGLVTMMGALTNAEAASMFPETGGQYILFKKMYGPLFAYLYGWASFIVINTAGIASIAYVAAYYLDYFYPLYRLSPEYEQSFVIHLPFIGNFYYLEHIGRKLVTILILLFFTVINVSNSKWAGNWQRGLTAYKLLLLVSLMLIWFWFQPQSQSMDLSLNNESFNLMGLVSALAGMFWCFDGWNNVSFVSGEIKHPETIIWKSLFYGLLTCTAIYFLFNWALHGVMPLSEIQSSDFVAAQATEKIWPGWGGSLVSAIVIFSVLSAVNGNILSCSRVSYSFFCDYQVSHKLTYVHEQSRIPVGAVWANTLWAIALIFIGSFDQLTELLIFISWFFYGMSAFGVILLRKRIPNAERSFRVPWYPWLPLVFIIFCTFYLGLTLFTDIQAYWSGQQTYVKSLLGFLLIIIGIPFYYKRNHISKSHQKDSKP